MPAVILVLSSIVPFANALGLRYHWQSATSGGDGWATELLALMAIIDAVLVTLASAQLPPNILACTLQDQWRTMFRQKQSTKIRRIQNSLKCCGLKSSRDMAWPFPNKKTKAGACESTLGRHVSCLGGWQNQEKTLLAFMIVIGGLSLASKVMRSSWLSSTHAAALLTEPDDT